MRESNIPGAGEKELAPNRRTRRLVCARAADLAWCENLRRSEEVEVAEREARSLGAWCDAGADVSFSTQGSDSASKAARAKRKRSGQQLYVE